MDRASEVATDKIREVCFCLPVSVSSRRGHSFQAMAVKLGTHIS